MTQAIQATADGVLPKADTPTMYFIGVTTGQSSIMRVFPAWARRLDISERIVGIDCRPHDDPAVYRRVVSFIKSDPLSLGALVTTHKIDLLAAARDLFDALDRYAELMGEVSSISKQDGRLAGHAKDLITSGLSLAAFLPEDHWKRTGAEVFCLGAGGSAIAVTCHVMEQCLADNRPSKLIVANRSTPRLEQMKRIHQKLNPGIPVAYHHCPDPRQRDAIVNGLKPGSLVINATGLGKDAPGSPLTDGANFPQRGYVWDFNYRGDLLFLKQARAQQQVRNLTIEDGWVYFLHGWTRVIAEVFHIDIPTSGPEFDVLSAMAAKVR
jgi:shikimate 5-dehydrogenase